MDDTVNVKVTKGEIIEVSDTRDMANPTILECATDTGEKGVEANNVETGCISNKVATTVAGVGTLPDGTITFNVDTTATTGNLAVIMGMIGTNKWFFESYDSGEGVVGAKWYAKINGITLASQTLGEMQTFTLNYTLVGDDYYWVNADKTEHALSSDTVYTPSAG